MALHDSPETAGIPPSTGPRRVRLGPVLLGIAVPIGLLVAWFLWPKEPLPAGVSSVDYAQARQRFQQLHRRRPSRTETLALLGGLAERDGRLEVAVACLRAIPSDDAMAGVAARLQEGQLLVRLNRAEEAERSLREFLNAAARDPLTPRDDLRSAWKWLNYLLSVELRLEERKALLAEVHASGLADVYDSKQYYFPHLLIWHSTTGRRRLREFLDHDPDNPRLNAASGRYLTAEGQLEEAQALLEAFHDRQPRDVQIAAALLECYFETNSWSEFATVAESLPPFEPSEPWLLTRMRGEFAVHREAWDEAARYFQAVLHSDPANPWSQMGLARAEGELGRHDAHEEMLHRSLILSEIRVGIVKVTETDPEASRQLAAQCDQIGYHAAAETFRRHALRIERGATRAPLPATTLAE